MKLDTKKSVPLCVENKRKWYIFCKSCDKGNNRRKKWNWSILEEKAERKETLDRREWRGERQREMEEEGEGEIGKRDNAANWLNDYNNNDNSNNNDNNKVHFFTRRLKRKNRREVKW